MAKEWALCTVRIHLQYLAIIKLSIIFREWTVGLTTCKQSTFVEDRLCKQADSQNSTLNGGSGMGKRRSREPAREVFRFAFFCY